jgi:hypothetical protein
MQDEGFFYLPKMPACRGRGPVSDPLQPLVYKNMQKRAKLKKIEI